jgi:predicted AAA+ superfamily ATPase
MIIRKIEKTIRRYLERKEITVITGARQVGKTTTIKKIISDLIRKGSNVLFLNLDFEGDARSFRSQEVLLKKIKLEFGEKPGYVFVDEIQRKENAGIFLKGLYDLELPYKFVVAGSGSLELKEKISESLAGRKRLVQMHPVTFEEFVEYKTQYKFSNRLHLLFETSPLEVDSLLFEYLSYGGYPKIITETSHDQKFEVINEIFSSYIVRDITNLLGVRNPDSFSLLIQLLASQCGTIINYSQLSGNLGISVDTLKRYLWYAEQTYVIKRITPYFTNYRKELTKSPMAYFDDLGLYAFARNRFGQLERHSDGLLFQNFTYQLLSLQFDLATSQIYYWRTTDRAEVDFVVRTADGVTPVEVKFSHLKSKTLSRSFRSFIQRYRPKQAFIINLSLNLEIQIDETAVRFVPYWYLLTNALAGTDKN